MSLSLVLKDGKLLLENGALVAGDPNLDGFGNCCCAECCIACKFFSRGSAACPYEYTIEGPNPPPPWPQVDFLTPSLWGGGCGTSGMVYRKIDENGNCGDACTAEQAATGEDGCTAYDNGVGCGGCNSLEGP